MADLAQVRIHQKKYDSAEVLLRAALHEYDSTMPDQWRRYLTQSLIGASLAGQGKLEQAESFLLNGYCSLLQREASIPTNKRPDLVEAGNWIVWLYDHWGKPGQAAQWRQRLPRGIPPDRY